MLVQVQLEVVIAALAEDLLCLDNLGCKAVTVTYALFADACVNKLIANLNLTEVPLFFDCVRLEHS